MGIPRPYLGCGIGLRRDHYSDFQQGSPQVAWCEAVSENFLGTGGNPMAVLEAVRRDRPVALHGVALGIGNAQPLDAAYLGELKELIARIEPALVTDHLCWGSWNGTYSHDLLPMPLTEESLTHVVRRVGRVQDALGRQVALENISSYAQFAASTLTEWDFLAAVAERADCGILLDVNNVYVNAFNHGFCAEHYLDALPAERVVQVHLAGHTDKGTHLLDTHRGPIPAPVWELYRRVVDRLGPVSTLIEWDTEIPPLEALQAEAARAAAIVARRLSIGAA